MSLKVPKLDDTTFNDLVEAAKRRIPQYAPEWTDYNLSDPGITIIELLAWLVEMELFHLDQLTEKHYERFLKLLGEERQPTETIEKAKARVKENLKKTCRAVTLADFEDLAKQTKGVSIARAKAFWNDSIGEVDVVVVPDDGTQATEELRKEVCVQLDSCRLLTTQIKVLSHEIVRVTVHAVIKAKPLASSNIVQKNVEDALEVFFNPLRGYDGSGWPFGRTIYASEVCAKIEEVDGVDCVQSLVFSAEGTGLIECKIDSVEIKKNALTDSGENHRIEVVGAQQPCKLRM